MSNALFIFTMICMSFCAFYLIISIPILLLIILPMERKALAEGLGAPNILFPFHPWAIIYKVCGYIFANSDEAPFGFKAMYNRQDLIAFRQIRSKHGGSIANDWIFFFMRFLTYAAVVGGFVAAAVILFNWDFFKHQTSK